MDPRLNLVPNRVFLPSLALTRNTMANGDASGSYVAVTSEPLKVRLSREEKKEFTS